LYQVIAESHGANVIQYDLLPDNGWECDLVHMERLLLENANDRDVDDGDDGDDAGGIPTRRRRMEIRGILINNPSNPTGAVYSWEHLRRIVELAERHRLPIISDEIYGDLTFGNRAFHPMADVAASMGYEVPIITASGLGKQCECFVTFAFFFFSCWHCFCFCAILPKSVSLTSASPFTICSRRRCEKDLVPGWRLGWIVFQDNRHGAIEEVKKGARRLAQVVLGACHLAQLAIPAVLDPVDESDRASTASWKENLHSTIEGQAALLCGLLNACHGLRVIFPDGGEPLLYLRCHWPRYHASPIVRIPTYHIWYRAGCEQSKQPCTQWYDSMPMISTAASSMTCHS
jgi:tyrosine aminotransferase